MSFNQLMIKFSAVSSTQWLSKHCSDSDHWILHCIPQGAKNSSSQTSLEIRTNWFFSKHILQVKQGLPNVDLWIFFFNKSILYGNIIMMVMWPKHPVVFGDCCPKKSHHDIRNHHVQPHMFSGNVQKQKWCHFDLFYIVGLQVRVGLKEGAEWVLLLSFLTNLPPDINYSFRSLNSISDWPLIALC